MFHWVVSCSYILVAYNIIELELSAKKEVIKNVMHRLDNFHLYEIVGCFLIIEGVVFALIMRKEENYMVQC